MRLPWAGMGKTRVWKLLPWVHCTSPGSIPWRTTCLEDPPGLVLLDRHAIDHRAVDIQGVAADRGPFGQREVEVALHRPGRRVGEGHGGGRFGHGAEDPHLGLQPASPSGVERPSSWTIKAGGTVWAESVETDARNKVIA